MPPEPKVAAAPAERPSRDEGRRDQLRFNAELVEAIGNPVYLKDLNGRFICVNRAWETFYGIRREDCIGKSVHDVFPKEAADMHAAQDAALLGGSPPRVYEVRAKSADGEMRDTVHYKSIFSRADGTPAGVIGSLTDITSLKRAEAALRLSEKQMRLISDNVPSLIAYFDSALRCFFCNKAYAEWFGGTPGEFQGRHLREVIGADVFAEIEPQVARAVAGEHVTYERPHRMKDGSTGYLQVALVPHLDGTGNVAGVYSLLADITDRKREEAKLAHSRERMHFALQGSNLALWDADVPNNEIYFDAEWAAILGYPPEETTISTKALLARVHPD
ncbi:MAG: PAS domain-containing protein, partial [Betaproteobacteria bacterium]